MDLEHVRGTALWARFTEVERVYAEAFPRYDLGDYRSRMRRQVPAPGFEAVTARAGGELIGFAYGLPLTGSTWWDGLDPAPPDGFTAEDGARTFAVIDLAVRREHRGSGLGRRLMGELLAGRTEQRATLATAADEAAIRRMYERWGWTRVGRVPGQEGETEPWFDLFVLDLRAGSDSTGSP